MFGSVAYSIGANSGRVLNWCPFRFPASEARCCLSDRLSARCRVEMPGLQGDNVVASLGSPVKKSKLSLKFFQKKEAKRTLDFSEPPPDESKTEPEPEDSIARWLLCVYL